MVCHFSILSTTIHKGLVFIVNLKMKGKETAALVPHIAALSNNRSSQCHLPQLRIPTTSTRLDKNKGMGWGREKETETKEKNERKGKWTTTDILLLPVSFVNQAKSNLYHNVHTTA